MNKYKSIIKLAFIESINIKQNIINNDNNLTTLIDLANIIANAIINGGKLLLCGNGGSAADAQHLATELLVRFRSNVERKSIPAIPLAMDTSMLTATGNDYSFTEVFTRPLSGLGKAGDVLLGISTSGKSANVLAAFRLAKQMNIITIGLLGDHDKGLTNALCDYSFIVPSKVTARIQEIHITIGHIIMELIEEILLNQGFINKIK